MGAGFRVSPVAKHRARPGPFLLSKPGLNVVSRAQRKFDGHLNWYNRRITEFLHTSLSAAS